ncbi:hypothetical protein DN069_31175 [Streptacidiphilus pinicola]|uniref:Uncharacterized protein n=1 Tax=Streptacidiphilus pinicola TaxID=2219663 RepID=A0A2X0I9Y8_9ACTN|nr:hypothetical protein DN069_31175 [Streptacidiphilus pinicola]
MNCSCPPPDRDLCLDCRGWGYQVGTVGDDRPKCPHCHGQGGQQPHDLACGALGPVEPAPPYPWSE